MRTHGTLAAAAVVVLWTTAAAAQTLTDQATPTDGDTLRLDGQRIRLSGIDAPELHQTCTANGREYGCGVSALAALALLITNWPVTCEVEGKDRYERLLATCWANGKDIGREMVRQGFALAYRRYSRRYVAAEEEARAERLGIWAGEFLAPWDWRRAR